ncbi:MAG: hypothetical protein MR031_00830 [Tenericutes bacterium]|nr:hypothetical protein [Mycoplasmatota bacterium]
MYPYDYNTLRGNNGNYPVTYAEDGERFFWAPFVVGGLAGTALGYGIANNNQLNNGNGGNNGMPCCSGYYYYPVPQGNYYPNPYGFNNFNNFYY